jgi:predicted O-methyltransferase YrrM
MNIPVRDAGDDRGQACQREIEMSLRSGVSGQLAAFMFARCSRHLTDGTALAVPPALWRLLPRFARSWLDYRVLAYVEELALRDVRAHDTLHRFAHELEQNRWAMSPSAILYLWHLLETARPARIVEFGSGLSTRVIAEHARQAKAFGQNVALVSIEHDAHWLSQTREALAREQTSEFVTFCHAPISTQHLLGRSLEAYSVDERAMEAAAGSTGFELCIVDGPPGTIGRAGCLPLVAPFLAANAVVLLDDALRPGELAVAREWRKTYGRQCQSSDLQLLDRHGLMRLRWKGPDVVRKAATSRSFELSVRPGERRGNQLWVGAKNRVS